MVPEIFSNHKSPRLVIPRARLPKAQKGKIKTEFGKPRFVLGKFPGPNVPPETGLLGRRFSSHKGSGPGKPVTSPKKGPFHRFFRKKMGHFWAGV